MTVKELFNFIKGVRPGFAFTDAQLTVWLNEIEGHVQTDIWLLEPAVDETQTGLVEYDSTIDPETDEMVDANHELLVPFPWNKLYRYFLLMSIDLANGEYQRYANSYELFNEAYEEYAGWYAQHVSPANGEAITRGYYISAYQFAARGGYAGTEEEFYEELAHVGEAVESGARAEAAAEAAEGFADDAETEALKAEGHAVGTQNGEDVPDTSPYKNNNAKYYSDEASNRVLQAGQKAQESEAWAVGTMDGIPVTSEDDQYHNNAKYWAGESATSATSGIAALANEAQTFDTTKAYSAGEYVLYNSALYQFTTNHAAGAWTGTDAKVAKIGEDVEVLNNIVYDEKEEEITWTQGGVTTSGEETDADSRIRSNIFYCGGRMRVKIPDNYKVGVALYDNDNEFVSWSTGWEGTLSRKVQNKCRLILAKRTDGVISTADGLNATCIISVEKSNNINPDSFSGTDTGRLQIAFDYCENSGGIIEIKRKYVITSPIIIDHVYEKNNRIIVQGSNQAELVCDGSYMFRGGHGTSGGVLFKNIKFSKNGSNKYVFNGGAVNSGTTLVNIVIENCYISGFQFVFFAEKYIQSFWLVGCVIRNISSSICNSSGYQWYNCIFHRCVIEGVNTLGRISYPEAVNITHNVIEGNSNIKACIIVSAGSYSLTIEGNYFEQNSSDIDLTELTNGEVRNIRIVGNVFANSAENITLPSSANPVYNGSILIENNSHISNSQNSYMVTGDSSVNYSTEVFCAFNAGHVTNLPAGSLKIYTPIDFTSLRQST